MRPDHTDRAILSYAVKYASAFYGPFREAAESAPAFGDRRQYQMDPANVREAIARGRAGRGRGSRSADGEAGAGLPGRRARGPGADPAATRGLQRQWRVRHGEGGRAAGWIDERRVVLEALTGMRRAGADAIITYHAKAAAGMAGGGVPVTGLRARQPGRPRLPSGSSPRRSGCLPGGVNSPVRAFRSVGGTPRFIARGEGPYLFDADGNRYLDLVLSWGPLILGHAAPRGARGHGGGSGTGHHVRRAHRAGDAPGRAGGGHLPVDRDGSLRELGHRGR